MLLRMRIDMPAATTRRRFESLVKGLDRVLVAYSGGIDSTLVLKVAHQQLGAEAVAATAVSPSLARDDLDDSQRIAEERILFKELPLYIRVKFCYWRTPGFIRAKNREMKNLPRDWQIWVTYTLMMRLELPTGLMHRPP